MEGALKIMTQWKAGYLYNSFVPKGFQPVLIGYLSIYNSHFWYSPEGDH